MEWFYIPILIGGAIGLLVVLSQKECPFCRMRIDRRASICPHCQKEQPNKDNKTEPKAEPAQRLCRFENTSDKDDEEPQSSFDRERGRGNYWIPVIIIITVALAIGILSETTKQNKSHYNKGATAPFVGYPETRLPEIESETLRTWTIPCGGKGGIGLELLVSETATREQVMSLARKIRRQHDAKGCLMLAIYDSRAAWLDRLDAFDSKKKLRLSEKEYFRHFLVDGSRNVNTGMDELNWVAVGRNH